MCVGCREKKEKRSLIRIVRTPSEEVIIDSTGKKAGRGAYICPNVECLAKAVKSKSLERALVTNIAPNIIEDLEKKLKDENAKN
ncbi:YlxR family protein [Bacillota bacterium LX-D]|nr:YlxR family protein [Bacillota bacterium LX-D]